MSSFFTCHKFDPNFAIMQPQKPQTQSLMPLRPLLMDSWSFQLSSFAVILTYLSLARLTTKPKSQRKNVNFWVLHLTLIIYKNLHWSEVFRHSHDYTCSYTPFQDVIIIVHVWIAYHDRKTGTGMICVKTARAKFSVIIHNIEKDMRILP